MKRWLLYFLPVLIVMSASFAQAVTPIPHGGEAVLQEGPRETIPPTDENGYAARNMALIAGADYLKAMQADITEDNAGNGTDGIDEHPDDPDDGGWDWRVTSPPDPFFHSTSLSSLNLYGVSANGVLSVYKEYGGADYFTTLTDAADTMAANTGVRSGADLVFLMEYNDLAGVSGTVYQDSAKAKYDARIATYGSAGGLARYIRDVRGVTQNYPNGIIAWDIGVWAVAAQMLYDRYGSPYDADADSIAEVIYQDSFMDNPGLFDIIDDAGWDPTYTDRNFWWYTLGITGLIDAFDAAQVHTDKIPELITRLLDSQYPSGAFSECYGAHTDDEDWQSAAYAAATLGEYDQATYQDEINMAAVWFGDTQDESGGYVYSNGNHYPEVAGEVTAGVAYSVADGEVGADVSGYGCISIDYACAEDIPFTITRSGSGPQMRGFDVTFTLTNLELCVDANTSITEGTYLTGNTQFYVVDNGGGSYTASCAILGGSTGPTGSGTLFEIDVTTAGTDGTGTIHIDGIKLRDLNNQPILGDHGADAELTIDTVAPVAITDLASSQVKSGNGTDGLTDIIVTFTAPGDASVIEVYRKGYGDYPEYDDGTGAVPTIPSDPTAAVADGWTLTTVTMSGMADAPTVRDYWYYVIFTEDDCGNISDVSNMTDGTLDYHLGDVSNGVAAGSGDNLVETADISILGTHYGENVGTTTTFNYLDVGPTDDYTVDGLPTTDDIVDFEDLMMFAMNFGEVGDQGGAMLAAQLKSESPKLALAMPAAALKPGSTVTARLLLEGNQSAVKGLHGLLQTSGLKLIEIAPGELLGMQTTQPFLAHIVEEAGVWIDAAALGQDQVIQGSGEVARLTFEIVAPGGSANLATFDLRGVENQSLLASSRTIKTEETPKVLSSTPRTILFRGALPNPFRGTTDIRFYLPQQAPVSLQIYDASGRLVRTLVDGSLPAGEYTYAWDGRHEAGRPMGAGIYLYTLRAGDEAETQKLFLVR